MSASDDLSKLSDRAAQAEKNVEAAKGKGQAALKAQADAARKSAAAQASSLEKDAAAAGADAKAKAAGLEEKSADSWSDMKTQWGEHVARLHDKHDQAKADLGAKQLSTRRRSPSAMPNTRSSSPTAPSRRLSPLALTRSRRAPRQTTRRPHKAWPPLNRNRSTPALVALGTGVGGCGSLARARVTPGVAARPRVNGLITPGERDPLALFKGRRHAALPMGHIGRCLPANVGVRWHNNRQDSHCRAGTGLKRGSRTRLQGGTADPDDRALRRID